MDWNWFSFVVGGLAGVVGMWLGFVVLLWEDRKRGGHGQDF
jgi:hypothetical protein